MEQKKTWQGKTDGGKFGQKSLFFYFKYGNIALSYAGLSFVIFFYLIVNFSAAKNIYYYFKRCHNFSAVKSLISTYRNHFLFGKTLIDKFAMFAGRRNEYAVIVDGQEIFDEVINNPNQGAIILNSHVGSAEIAGYLLSQNKKKLNVIVYGGEASVMQDFRSNILEKQNIFMIPVTDGFSHIFTVNNAIKNAELLGMAGDRIYEGSKNMKIDFFGLPASFPTNPFQLAVKLKAPILSLFVMQEGYKKYHAYVIKIDVEDLQSFPPQKQLELLMNQYVENLEFMMKKYPLQWYNFYKFWD